MSIGDFVLAFDLVDGERRVEVRCLRSEAHEEFMARSAAAQEVADLERVDAVLGRDEFERRIDVQLRRSRRLQRLSCGASDREHRIDRQIERARREVDRERLLLRRLERERRPLPGCRQSAADGDREWSELAEAAAVVALDSVRSQTPLANPGGSRKTRSSPSTGFTATRFRSAGMFQPMSSTSPGRSRSSASGQVRSTKGPVVSVSR